MLTTDDIQTCIIWACQHEVTSPKPGNVNCFSEGHNMHVSDFINSAHAIAPIMAQSNLSIGQMILESIRATRAMVNCNTNLGIVLLFAPLCKAINTCLRFDQLRPSLRKVLKNLTLDDAQLCYEAIRLAQPGGMGKQLDQDVNAIPTVTLRQAMKLASDRDLIASQYINNYQEVFHIGVEKLTTAIKCGESIEWATAFAYLKLLSEVPDSLICRKQGHECAHEVMMKAQKLINKVIENKPLNRFEHDIKTWDTELKQKAINPGTTADLTATTLLVYAFGQALS